MHVQEDDLSAAESCLAAFIGVELIRNCPRVLPKRTLRTMDKARRLFAVERGKVGQFAAPARSETRRQRIPRLTG
jgi:hypothetical protein